MNHLQDFVYFCVYTRVLAFNARILHSSFVFKASIRALLVIHDLDLSATIPVKMGQKRLREKKNCIYFKDNCYRCSWQLNIHKGNLLFIYPKCTCLSYAESFILFSLYRAPRRVEYFFHWICIIFEILFIASVRAYTYQACVSLLEKRHR